jgi:hypothetical protein
LQQSGRGVAFKQQEFAAELLQGFIQRLQAVVQPPTGGAPSGPLTRGGIVEYVARENGFARGGCGTQAGQVLRAQILTVPVNNRFLHGVLLL